MRGLLRSSCRRTWIWRTSCSGLGKCGLGRWGMRNFWGSFFGADHEFCSGAMDGRAHFARIHTHLEKHAVLGARCSAVLSDSVVRSVTVSEFFHWRAPSLSGFRLFFHLSQKFRLFLSPQGARGFPFLILWECVSLFVDLLEVSYLSVCRFFSILLFPFIFIFSSIRFFFTFFHN